MKQRISVAVVTFVALLLGFPALAAADQQVTTVAAAISVSPVYVTPEIEGANDVTSELLRQLHESDYIALVLLPDGAASDPNTFARQLSDLLQNERIIGLAIGDQLIGYAPRMPAGVADDLMRRAESVATTTPEALGTFVRNVHKWQAANPEPKPPSPPAPPIDLSPVVPIGGAVLVAAVAVGGVVIWRKNRMDQMAYAGYIRLRSPRRYRRTLKSIMRHRDELGGGSLFEALTQICKDADHYFQDKPGDNAAILHEDLRKIDEVLKRYLKIKASPRYYTDADALLRQGSSSILDFQDFVLKVARQGNDLAISDYTVDTGILNDAHHYLR